MGGSSNDGRPGDGEPVSDRRSSRADNLRLTRMPPRPVPRSRDPLDADRHSGAFSAFDTVHAPPAPGGGTARPVPDRSASRAGSGTPHSHAEPLPGFILAGSARGHSEPSAEALAGQHAGYAPAAPPVPRRRGRGLLILGLAVALAVGGGAAVAFWPSAAAAPLATPPTPIATTDASVPPGDPSQSGVLPGPDVLPSEPAATAPSPAESRPVKGRKNPSRANLALRGRASASAVEGSAWAAGYATDGDETTRWSSGFSDKQWLKVDLRRSWQLNEITLIWEHAYGVGYRVDTSLDGTTWDTLWETTSGTGGTVRIPAGNTVARYVRMYGTKRVSTYGYSLLEFQVR